MQDFFNKQTDSQSSDNTQNLDDMRRQEAFSSTNDTSDRSNRYDPYSAYQQELAHKEPFRGPNDHPVPPPRRQPNKLAKLALSMSIASFLLCCCSPYLGILLSIMSITLAICSRFFDNEERRFHTQAVIALMLGIISLVLILGSFMITYLFVPYLLETSPEFKEIYNQTLETLLESYQSTP